MNSVKLAQYGNLSALISDATFTAIHDAFQMGWSLIELKSRLQMAATSSIISNSRHFRATNNSSGQPSINIDMLLQEVLAATDNVKAQTLTPEVNVALRFSSSVTRASKNGSGAARQSPTEMADSSWLNSIWRATFNRIVTSHKNCLPGSSTTGTLYDLPDRTNAPDLQTLLDKPQDFNVSTLYLPYLYLYTNYGSRGIKYDNTIPDEFKLYDVTRRALNCLTILYTDPAQSLTPATIDDLQTQLLRDLTSIYSLTTRQTGVTASPATPETAATTTSPTPVTNAQAPSLAAQRCSAIQTITKQAVLYLEIWDCYARETLYSNDNGDNGLQLMAFEAGRALASLSWGISATTVSIEDELQHALSRKADTPERANLLETFNSHPRLKRQLREIWLTVFSERNIASIQHQITALSAALDEAYYRVNPDLQRQDTSDTTARPDPNLPSLGLHAINHSLDYWRRAVALICAYDAPSSPNANTSPDTQSATPSQKTQPQAIDQPQAGPPLSPAIPTMTWQVSSQLRLALIQQTEIWQALLLCQQTLQDFTAAHITQRICSDFMKDLEQAAQEGRLNPVEKQLGRYIIPIAAVLIIALAVFVLLMLRDTSQQQSFATVLTLIVGSVLGFFSTMISRVSAFFSPTSTSGNGNTAQNITNSILSIFGMASATLFDAFQNGYKQLLVEFDTLNHSTSVAFPLIEFFLRHSDLIVKAEKLQQPIAPAKPSLLRRFNKAKAESVMTSKNPVEVLIRDAYDFLVYIVWNQEERVEEIARVARAAFGPIGAFVGAKLK